LAICSKQEDNQSLRELQELLGQGGVSIIDIFNRERSMLKYNANRGTEFKWAFLPILLKFNNRLARRCFFGFLSGRISELFSASKTNGKRKCR
jgi:hypothetical protein